MQIGTLHRVPASNGACLMHAGIFVSAAGPASSPMYHATPERSQEMLAAARRNNQCWPSGGSPHSIMRSGSNGYRFTDDACELARLNANDLQVGHTAESVRVRHAKHGLQQPSNSIAYPSQWWMFDRHKNARAGLAQSDNLQER